jgi:hypothetical protein
MYCCATTLVLIVSQIEYSSDTIAVTLVDSYLCDIHQVCFDFLK